MRAVRVSRERAPALGGRRDHLVFSAEIPHVGFECDCALRHLSAGIAVVVAPQDIDGAAAVVVAVFSRCQVLSK